MKLLISGVSLVALMGLASPAFSKDLYITVFGGASLPRDLTFDGVGIDQHYTLGLNTGYVAGGAIGMDVTDAVRAEIEISHAVWKSADSVTSVDSFGASNTSPASGNVNATYLLANAWMDFDTGSILTPYLGGGVGLGWLSGDTIFGAPNGFGTSTGAGFAFQVGTGVKVDLSENMALDVGYRFKDIVNASAHDLGGAGQPEFNNVSVSSHNLQIGLTVKF
jgi:opacity protein-like surface antigen